MQRAMKLQLVFLFFLALSVKGIAQTDSLVTHRNVSYGQSDGEELLLDIHVPDGEGLFPVAIYVHGGAGLGEIRPIRMMHQCWSCWQKQSLPGSLLINYRLAPEHRWPACQNDVQAAIRWVKANAEKYKGDASRIVLVGYSAGGQLATYAATVVDESINVQAVIGCAPLTDFVQELPKRGNILGSAQRGLLNRPQELTMESLGMLKALSPVNYIRPGLPPFLLIHGDADRSVPYEQSLIFQTKMRTNGDRCDLITIPGAPHRIADWSKYRPDYGDEIISRLNEILNHENGKH